MPRTCKKGIGMKAIPNEGNKTLIGEFFLKREQGGELFSKSFSPVASLSSQCHVKQHHQSKTANDAHRCKVGVRVLILLTFGD